MFPQTINGLSAADPAGLIVDRQMRQDVLEQVTFDAFNVHRGARIEGRAAKRDKATEQTPSNW